MRVGVVAPSCSANEEDLESGMAVLKELGLEVVLSDEVLRPRSFTADDDRARADALNAMLSRNDIDAVVCARGGYGSSRLLPFVDPASLGQGKALMGFSDITSLHLFLEGASGLRRIWGPMVSVNFGPSDPARVTELTLRALEDRLGGEDLLGGIDGATPLVAGSVEAPVTGGTLCLCCETLGTPWEMDSRGKLLLLEDQNESPYRIDRYLTQLGHAGKFQDAAGFILGRTFARESPEDAFPLTVEELLWQHIGALGKPTLCSVPTGHSGFCLPIPLGTPVRLVSDPQAGERRLLVLA